MKLQLMMDKFAIGLSAMCAIHCLAVPVLLVLLPSTAVLGLGNEQFHFWMLVAVLPSSLLALVLGCKKHKKYRFFMFGVVGLLLLVIAAYFGAGRLGEVGETALTILGSSFIILGHWLNFRSCKTIDGKHQSCQQTV
ncbi:MerC domain-containing protein [Pseudoalteromonas arabiensis]|uniref:MerC domain-containing protein n=1 Tax=Pseudoalteromonas arabiensis TaxID=874454 RepID=UPI000AC82F19|nr:MerC domain-containing protein [Pseudoalteromonas arabiensis]